MFGVGVELIFEGRDHIVEPVLRAELPRVEDGIPLVDFDAEIGRDPFRKLPAEIGLVNRGAGIGRQRADAGNGRRDFIRDERVVGNEGRYEITVTDDVGIS
jgi:hypothetical protein